MLGTGVRVITHIREGEEEEEEEEEVCVYRRIIRAWSQGRRAVRAAVGSHSSCSDGCLIGRLSLPFAVGSNGP